MEWGSHRERGVGEGRRGKGVEAGGTKSLNLSTGHLKFRLCHCDGLEADGGTLQ